MKHYLTTFFLSLFCYVNLFPKPPSVMQTKNDPEKIDIIIENKENPNKDERNLNAFLINPYIDKLQAIVYVELYNVGAVNVKIMDSCGNVVCDSYARTIIPITLQMQLPLENDSFFIEINSSKYYAYGFFNF